MVATCVMCEIPAIPDNYTDQERREKKLVKKKIAEQKTKKKRHKFNPLKYICSNAFFLYLYLNANIKFNKFKCSHQKAKRLMVNPIFPHCPINPIFSQS